jgi:uncharacterized membrane protein YhaH (DUF805 family)
MWYNGIKLNRNPPDATNIPDREPLSPSGGRAMDYVRFLFSFEGRINRAKYWLATLIILCCMISVLLILATLASVFGIYGGPLAINLVGISASIQFSDDDPASKASLIPQLVMIPMTLVFAWSYAAASVKRLHDRDKSGWWMIPFFAVPGLYNQFADRFGDYWIVALPFGLIAFVFCLWGFIEMYFLKGSRKTNRFGRNPLLPVDTRPRWDQQSELEFVPRSAGPPAGA